MLWTKRRPVAQAVDVSQEWNETFRRLLSWPSGQGPAERLAAQILDEEDYTDINPSHPLGGRDGGKDLVASKDGRSWAVAVYFPRNQQSFTDIRTKFAADVDKARAAGFDAVVFITNQELRLGERAELENLAGTAIQLFHLERLTSILDRPHMDSVRRQFLGANRPDATPPSSWHDLTGAAPRTAGSPDHWSLFDGFLLMRVLVRPAPAARHTDAADPGTLLGRASEEATLVASAWPNRVSALVNRLKEGWAAPEPHIWTAGRMTKDLEKLANNSWAAVAFDTRTGALAIERTWPTRLGEDGEPLSYLAAREPNVVAELLVSLRLAGAMMVPYGTRVDAAFYVGAVTGSGFLVSTERAGGPRFEEPVARVQNPRAEVPARHLDHARFGIEQLNDPYDAAGVLAGPWLATFHRGDLLARLRPD
jgi:hypothetical protein